MLFQITTSYARRDALRVHWNIQRNISIIRRPAYCCLYSFHQIVEMRFSRFGFIIITVLFASILTISKRVALSDFMWSDESYWLIQCDKFNDGANDAKDELFSELRQSAVVCWWFSVDWAAMFCYYSVQSRTMHTLNCTWNVPAHTKRKTRCRSSSR